MGALGGQRKPSANSPNVASSGKHSTTLSHMPGCKRARFSVRRACGGAVIAALIADALMLLRGVRVEHIMHGATAVPHVPTAGVRVEGARLIYDRDEDLLKRKTAE